MENSINVTFRIPVWLDKLFTWPILVYRKLKYKYAFRRIYLGEGKFTKVDQADYYRLNQYHWIAYGKPDLLYAVRFALGDSGKMNSFSMHREIMKPAPGILIDHHNGDAFDNRRDNLRPATRSENCFNRRKTKSKTSSKYIGVCLDKYTGKWTAKIKCNNKSIYLGSFVCEADAAKAYDEAAKKYHGEFARLNFPESHRGDR